MTRYGECGGKETGWCEGRCAPSMHSVLFPNFTFDHQVRILHRRFFQSFSLLQSAISITFIFSLFSSFPFGTLSSLSPSLPESAHLCYNLLCTPTVPLVLSLHRCLSSKAALFYFCLFLFFLPCLPFTDCLQKDSVLPCHWFFLFSLIVFVLAESRREEKLTPKWPFRLVVFLFSLGEVLCG